MAGGYLHSKDYVDGERKALHAHQKRDVWGVAEDGGTPPSRTVALACIARGPRALSLPQVSLLWEIR